MKPRAYSSFRSRRLAISKLAGSHTVVNGTSPIMASRNPNWYARPYNPTALVSDTLRRKYRSPNVSMKVATWVPINGMPKRRRSRAEPFENRRPTSRTR